jgi:hypothetical protein
VLCESAPAFASVEITNYGSWPTYLGRTRSEVECVYERITPIWCIPPAPG